MELNKIYNMDCVDGLKQMVADGNTVDCVITSPPYNTMRNNQDDVGYDVYKDGIDNTQYCDWTVSIFNLIDKILSPNGKILYNMSYGSENTECMSLTIADILRRTNFTIADIIVWEKKTATPNNVSKNKLTRICEFVYVFARRSDFLTFETNKKVVGNIERTGQAIYENIYNKVVADNNDGSNELNKATYSVDLVNQLMSIYCKKTDVVLDPFMGTGTTAVACKRKGNPFIGFELSDKQCEYANKWLSGNKTISSLF